MEEDTRRVVGFMTAQLVVLAALIHVSLGAFNWLRWLQGGFLVPQDLRWVVSLLSGLAVLAGVVVARRAEDRRPFYLAGAVIMVGYVVGYFGWHLGGHRLFLIAGPGAGTESVSLAWFLDHLFAGPLEFASIFVETLAAAGLVALYRAAGRESDRPEGTATDPAAEGDA
jgi:hypothetical protein